MNNKVKYQSVVQVGGCPLVSRYSALINCWTSCHKQGKANLTSIHV